MDNNKLQGREGFGSKAGIIAAAAGSAIGLGNIWKFPYITGLYGGASFLVVYLICIAFIGVTVMLAEFIIGRKAGKNAIGSFIKLAPGKPWFLAGWTGVVAAFMILSFYGVVAGWSLHYIVKAATNAFEGLTPEYVGNLFDGFVSATFAPVVYQVLFMFMTGYIVAAGVGEGIEKYSKILMPLLLVLLIILDIRALTLPGADLGMAFLFSPDWSKINGEVILVALGHAFFSLSLGMGTMITYGSYIGKREDLAETAVQVSIADTVIALLAGIAIFPAVFAFGVEPASGPSLVFVTLPNLFNRMAGGAFFATLFFVLLSIAALTSSISILEVVVAYFIEELRMERKKATVIATVSITLIGMLCSLSNSASLGPALTFGAFGSFFNWMDKLSANYLLPLGGLLICLFVGWHLSREEVAAEIGNEGELETPYLPLFLFATRFIAPVAIAVVFLNGLGLIRF